MIVLLCKPRYKRCKIDSIQSETTLATQKVSSLSSLSKPPGHSFLYKAKTGSGGLSLSKLEGGSISSDEDDSLLGISVGNDRSDSASVEVAGLIYVSAVGVSKCSSSKIAY